MAYDEDLAARIRVALSDQDGITDRRMFGGLAFMVDGHMAVCASGDGGLLLRADPADTESIVGEDGVARFQMRGRELNGWVGVDPTAVSSDDQLKRWVDIGIAYARSLPPKQST
jgi:TfoX/Sxy family transcriptional regulator of competence genes